MKYVNNEHASQDPNGSARSDRGTLIQRRALILGILAIPCLLTIVGLGLGPLALPWFTMPAIFAFLTFLLFFIAYLLKEIPLLRKASQYTFWYQKTIRLDEREKLVIDQAFRTSYRILALVCVICLIYNNDLHLSNRMGPAVSPYILAGVLWLLIFLPATIVAWHESLWVQKEETRVR